MRPVPVAAWEPLPLQAVASSALGVVCRTLRAMPSARQALRLARDMAWHVLPPTDLPRYAAWARELANTLRADLKDQEERVLGTLNQEGAK